MASAVGRAVTLPVVVVRLREAGHRDQANELVAARAFGALLDRARDAVANLPCAAEPERAGVKLPTLGSDSTLRKSIRDLRSAATIYVEKANTAAVKEATSVRDRGTNRAALRPGGAQGDRNPSRWRRAGEFGRFNTIADDDTLLAAIRELRTRMLLIKSEFSVSPPPAIYPGCRFGARRAAPYEGARDDITRVSQRNAGLRRSLSRVGMAASADRPTCGFRKSCGGHDNVESAVASHPVVPTGRRARAHACHSLPSCGEGPDEAVLRRAPPY